MSDPLAGKKLSFDEFKLFYESAEKVTDRRLATNSWNYSICIAVIGGVAVILQWSLSTPMNFVVGVVAIILLCVMAAIFCLFWVGQIDDFKSLNNAKFAVLNEMAPHLEFDSQNSGKVGDCSKDTGLSHHAALALCKVLVVWARPWACCSRSRSSASRPSIARCVRTRYTVFCILR